MSQAADDSNFDQILGQDGLPVLVDFWAPWCKPCQALGPLLEDVEASNDRRFRLVKVNADESKEVAQRFNVRSLPTLVLLAEGKTVSRKIGNLSRPMLERWLSEAMPTG